MNIIVSQKAIMKVLAATIIVAMALGSAGASLLGITFPSEPILPPSTTSNTPIQTPMPSPKQTAAISTPTQIPEPTSTPIATLTPIPTHSPFPISFSFNPAPTIPFEPTVFPSETPTPTPTLTPTPTPTVTPAPTPSPTPAPTPTPTPYSNTNAYPYSNAHSSSYTNAHSSPTTSRGVISITFDDGTRSQYTTAFPLMRDRNIVGTFYIPTGNFPTDNPYNKITASELLQMQNAGNEIGSHSVSHLDFTKLNETQIRQEYSESKATLQSYGLTVNNFAYPYGTGDLSYANSIASQYYRSTRIVFYSPMTIANAPFQLSAVYSQSQGAQYANLLPD